ncbi:MAG TPA: nucleoside-diphosphate sugar epimerase/dehydratase [Abditibacteriaceae bacterium]
MRQNSLWHTRLQQFMQGLLRHGRANVLKSVIDFLLIILAACWTWFVSFSQVTDPGSPLPFLIVVVSARVLLYRIFRLDLLSWFTVSRHDVMWIAATAILGVPLILLVFFLLPEPFTLRAMTRPHLILVTEPALYTLLLCAARITARAAYSSKAGSRRVLIVGAGDAGLAIAFQIQESRGDFDVVGFVDDADHKQGRRFRGLPVLAKISDIEQVTRTRNIQEIIIAIPSLKPDALREVLKACEPTGLPVRTLPPLHQIIGRQPDVTTLREVRMEDLLPRPAVDLDRAVLTRYLAGHTVLVTGGGGSIGSELCRQVLAAGVSRLLVLGRGENSVFEIVQELREHDSQCEIVPIICDVRDRTALERIFQRYEIDIVFHAAAHKHVPLMESYPGEAVKNNVVGTLNLVELTVQYQVNQFVMVSTDKAVEPTNVMGATKRIGELIVKAYATEHQRNMVCVRFGNVLGSRGSVVLTMRRQIQRGQPVTVTDPDMVRFFMTIPEAVQLILQAGSIGGCGEIFVLDMGRPVRILDLAHDLIRLSGLVPHQDIPINIVGRRPGEKVKEDILSSTESDSAEKSGPFFMAPSQFVQMEALQNHLAALREAADEGDAGKIIGLIKDIVPEFLPDANQVAIAGNNGTGALHKITK